MPRTYLPAASVAALLLGAIVAHAAPAPPAAGAIGGSDQQRAREARRRGDYVALAGILTDAERRYPGRVIEVDLDDDRYEIEILQANGRVVELEYNARSGRLEDVEYDED